MIKYVEKLARGSGKILLEYLNKKKVNKITVKDNFSYVGEADIASEDFIINNIEKHYPQSKIIAEEKGVLQSDERNSGLTWVIDPLDGTTNYIHGFPFFCVSIGVMEGNNLIAGVIYNPANNEMYSAANNKGAYLNKNKISVSKIDSFKDSLLITGFYYDQGTRLAKQIERFKKVQNITQSVRRLGSAALDLCYVACGKADGFWEENLNPWDVAAGTIILTESGGEFSDFNNGEGCIFGEQFVYSNSIIHGDFLRALDV